MSNGDQNRLAFLMTVTRNSDKESYNNQNRQHRSHQQHGHHRQQLLEKVLYELQPSRLQASSLVCKLNRPCAYKGKIRQDHFILVFFGGYWIL